MTGQHIPGGEMLISGIYKVIEGCRIADCEAFASAASAWASGKHMGTISRSLLLYIASACLLAGCAVGELPPPGRHLSDIECRDLTALTANKKTTMAEHQVELGALRKAGYNPSPFWDDPYYPQDIQDAQRLVDYWFQTECMAMRTQ